MSLAYQLTENLGEHEEVLFRKERGQLVIRRTHWPKQTEKVVSRLELENSMIADPLADMLWQMAQTLRGDATPQEQIAAVIRERLPEIVERCSDFYANEAVTVASFQASWWSCWLHNRAFVRKEQP